MDWLLYDRDLSHKRVNDLAFIKSFEIDSKYFLINFSGLQQEVLPIFKLLYNSTIINM